MGKGIDLTNQRFGRLVALYKCDYKKGANCVWHCKCDCGNSIDVITADLRREHTTSCGCLRKEKCAQTGHSCKGKIAHNAKDLIGQTFNYLTVLEKINPTDYCKYNRTFVDQRQYWRCKCVCGAISACSTGELTTSHIQSCGCIKSLGEQNIAKLLTQNNISFVRECKFDDCLSINNDSAMKPRFDFYVNNEYIIEFDGEQHYKENNYFNSKRTLQEVQKADNYKNNWCKEHNIPIIRIPYWKRDSIQLEDLLLTTSEFII